MSPKNLHQIIAPFLLLALTSPTTLPAQTQPQPHPPHIILLIRHAEKPDPPAAGTPKDPNLSKRGYERADALAKTLPANFPKPDFLFATKATAGSNRPVETIIPLSKAVAEPIDSTFKKDDIETLAHELLTNPRYAGKTILIAWHHEEIPALAKALGAKDAPTTWDANTFDRVWQITYDNNSPTFKDLPQKTLPGDSDK